jgi:hypothetical protein
MSMQSHVHLDRIPIGMSDVGLFGAISPLLLVSFVHLCLWLLYFQTMTLSFSSPAPILLSSPSRASALSSLPAVLWVSARH